MEEEKANPPKDLTPEITAQREQFEKIKRGPLIKRDALQREVINACRNKDYKKATTALKKRKMIDRQVCENEMRSFILEKVIMMIEGISKC